MRSSAEKQRHTHLRVSLADQNRLKRGQFTSFDLVERCFSFPAKRKLLAAQILTLIRQRPRTYNELRAETGANKSSLYLTLSALEQSGLVLQLARAAPFALSAGFADILEGYAGFWRAQATSQT